MSLVLHLQSTLSRLCGDAVRLVVGVSGGADSVALLRLAVDAGWRERVIGAHLNHQLRGREAEDDAEWVASLCAHVGVSLELQSLDVEARAVESGTGIEETARAARYAFFAETALKHGATFVAVAHTADDQAETVLHHLLRGTGLAGLAGMPEMRPLDDVYRASPGVAGAGPKGSPGEGLSTWTVGSRPAGVSLRSNPGHPLLIRPLLGVPREELRSYLAGIGQNFREDSSNVSRDYTRNRLRTELLPLLAREFNPQIVQSLLSLSSIARDAQAALSHRARQLLATCPQVPQSDSVQIDVSPLRDEPRHLVREMFVELWKSRNWPRQPMSARHWDELAAVALGEVVAVTLPGAIEARRKRGMMSIGRVGR